jgi:hypothetical protein
MATDYYTAADVLAARSDWTLTTTTPGAGGYYWLDSLGTLQGPQQAVEDPDLDWADEVRLKYPVKARHA